MKKKEGKPGTIKEGSIIDETSPFLIRYLEFEPCALKFFWQGAFLPNEFYAVGPRLIGLKYKHRL